MHRGLTVPMPFLRMWVHCPRASNGLLPRRSNLVGYVRWDARSDRFPPCQTIIPTAFRSQSGLPTNRELIGLLRWFQTPELWLKTRSVRLWVLGVLQQLCLILRRQRFCFCFELRLSVPIEFWRRGRPCCNWYAHLRKEPILPGRRADAQ